MHMRMPLHMLMHTHKQITTDTSAIPLMNAHANAISKASASRNTTTPPLHANIPHAKIQGKKMQTLARAHTIARAHLLADALEAARAVTVSLPHCTYARKNIRMLASLDAYTHTRIHAYTHTRVCTCIHIYAYMHTRILAYI